MSDLSGLTPIPKEDKLFHPVGKSTIIYSREWPYGRVYLPGGGRAIAPYGRSYPLPEALTEIRLSEGARLPAYQIRRLSGNPNGNLKSLITDNWKLIVAAVGVISFIALVSH